MYFYNYVPTHLRVICWISILDVVKATVSVLSNIQLCQLFKSQLMFVLHLNNANFKGNSLARPAACLYEAKNYFFRNIVSSHLNINEHV